VLIFPEGTRTSYGEAGKYKRGAAMLARAGQVELIPIAHNAGKYWSKNSWWIKPGVIRFVVGQKIEYQDRTDTEVTSDIKDWVLEQNL
jgi:1-acyl-sn-glycerol-3-phosphate acyltransferase